jgi:hypothetical protein
MKNNQLKQTILTISAVLLTAISLSACNGGGGYSSSGGGYSSGGGGGTTYVDPYKKAWFDVYGTQCINNGYPMAGCNFYADGTKISSSADPYYSNMTLYFDYWTYTDSYGYSRSYNGYAWLSSTGILYDDYGNALNEQDADSAQSADVIALASQKEVATTKLVGKNFAQKYALAEDAGVSIAKTLQDWAVLGRDRARTEDDVAAVSTQLYGVSLDKAKGALIEASKGNQAALDDVNVDVAAHWGTSPETSKNILTKWYKDELSQMQGYD